MTKASMAPIRLKVNVLITLRECKTGRHGGKTGMRPDRRTFHPPVLVQKVGVSLAVRASFTVTWAGAFRT